MADVDAGSPPGTTPAVRLFGSLGFRPGEVLLQLECMLDQVVLENGA